MSAEFRIQVGTASKESTERNLVESNKGPILNFRIFFSLLFPL